MCSFRHGVIGALLLVSAMQTSGQQSPPQLCQTASFRQFDFWVGEWEVRDQTGKPAGRNSITLEQNGCVLVERWTSMSGGTGMSMNHYDPQAAVWRQHWVGVGVILEMSGGMKDREMILEGPLQYLADGRVTLLRGTWTPLPDGRVRQHFIESADQGKTWTEWFDGYYSKNKPETR